MKIKTPAGILTLRKPTLGKLKALATLIPLSEPFDHPCGIPVYGIIMKSDAGEAMAIKQQSIEIPDTTINERHSSDTVLLVRAIKHYLSHEFCGALLPCVYIRPKSLGMVEVGFAYFGHADQADANMNSGSELPEFDKGHGQGFSRMAMAFMQCLSLAAKESGLPLAPTIDLDHRPRSLLNTLSFSFLIHGQDIYSLKMKPSVESLGWELLRSAGIKEVYALPSVPFETG